VDRRNFFKFLAVAPVAVTTLPKSEVQAQLPSPAFIGANWPAQPLRIDESMGVVLPSDYYRSVPVQGFIVNGKKR
jgi:hypothetical protein